MLQQKSYSNKLLAFSGKKRQPDMKTLSKNPKRRKKNSRKSTLSQSGKKPLLENNIGKEETLKEVICALCNGRYKNVAEYVSHPCCAHVPVKFRCSQCTAVLDSYDNYNLHMSNIHNATVVQDQKDIKNEIEKLRGRNNS